MRSGGTERTERMLELIPTNKTEHPRFAIRGVRFKDWEPRIRVASPDEFSKLVTQGAHRVRVSDVDHFNIAIGLVEREKRGRARPGQVICEKKK